MCALATRTFIIALRGVVVNRVTKKLAECQLSWNYGDYYEKVSSVLSRTIIV